VATYALYHQRWQVHLLPEFEIAPGPRWIEEEYRHEGIARQLVTLAVERFGRIGVKQVRCDTAWLNEPARSLFTRCGFRPSIVEMLIEL
jgi:RimJ/RimL family protein N-acetyltransferase